MLYSDNMEMVIIDDVGSYYREEDNIPENSKTETFVALKLHINNFRWAGTLFYIRTGKRLGRYGAEIVIQFKDLPNILYFKDRNQEPNILVIRIQPNVCSFSLIQRISVHIMIL